jgi:hypothetical protein
MYDECIYVGLSYTYKTINVYVYDEICVRDQKLMITLFITYSVSLSYQIGIYSMLLNQCH